MNSQERGTLGSYIVSGNQLATVNTKFSGKKIIVAPLVGLKSDAIGDLNSDFSLAIKPRSDGVRLSCFMLADETVALATIVAHWADMDEDDEYHILWLFDDCAELSTYCLNDDIRDELQIVSAIAEAHNPLTREEVLAWQSVAARADYLGIFEYVDLCDAG
ncbi:hypothetical protein [Paraburkholderia caledonica]|uniref:hypothetical protein n=1 Tax=Paraburkholderia caledonica TaxID=134536 RepID=UPI001177AA36|nr:hypothetical protein [Paraburkholderia caledonica]